MKRVALLLPGCMVLGLAAPPAGAETSKSFSVTAVIATGCSVVTDGAGHWGQINLGTVNGALGGTASASLLNSGLSDLRINCTPGTSVNVTADNGNHASGGTRRLEHTTQTGNFVSYTLYANGSQTPWTSQSIPLSFPVGTSQRLLPVSAQAIVPAATRAGAYADTVRVTVSW
jgi:spore coat protein U-like protein